MSPKDINTVFSDKALEIIREEIKDSHGNEVYFGINFNEHYILHYVDVIARGNSDSVPAIISLSLEYDAVLHNHPSGALTPSRADLQVASEIGDNAGVGFYITNNEASDYYEVFRPIKAQSTVKIDVAEALYMFTDHGIIPKTLKNYEYRQEQTELVEATVNAMNENKHLIAEAGTGIGKSLSYLVPALIWLKENKTRIVISTNTINLQEQIILKDIPAIIETIAPNIKYSLVKGRHNYVCIKKVKDNIKEYEGRFDSPELFKFFENIDEWTQGTKDGTISDLGYKPSQDFWEMVNCDNDTCTKRKCAYLEDCFFYKMKKEINASQLLIVNHHILCADLALHAETGGRYSLLPTYSKVIIDEAHNFENSASSYFGNDGSKSGVLKALFYISNNTKERNKKTGFIDKIKYTLHENKNIIDEADYKNILVMIEKAHENTTRLRNMLDDSSKTFLAYCHKHIDIKNASYYKFRITETLINSNHWESGVSALRETVSAMTSLVNICDKLMTVFFDIILLKKIECDELMQMSAAYTERLKRQLVSLNNVINYKKDEFVRWIETRITKRGNLILSWHMTPVYVGESLNNYLYSRFDSVMLYSATLTVGKSFNFFSKRLGFDLILENRRESIYLESTFDYPNNSRLYIAKDSPETTSIMFDKFIADTALKTSSITGGRTFILFTSFKSLSAVYDLTYQKLKNQNINALTQSSGMHRHTMLDLFKSSDNNILFGVDSFWEGVDVVGKNLELVIIPKLPFAVPTDPISEGRYEYIEESGGNAFLDYALPLAVIKFKQGFGRLIRSKNDRGVVLVLDKRLVTKNYGKHFINSLPKTKVCVNDTKNILKDMANFFEY